MTYGDPVNSSLDKKASSGTAKAVGSNYNGLDKKGIVRAIVSKRHRDCRANPDLLERDPWSLSTIWYLSERYFKAYGLPITEDTRRTVSNQYVLEICRDELHCTRASIGIYAAARGLLYYNGEGYLVTLDTMSEISGRGSDLIYIEKGAPAQALSKLAAKSGIAILSTAGFATENNIDLGALVQEKGGNVAALHDLDSSGATIQLKVPGVFDLGLDFEFLEELGIDLSEVEQSTHETGHWKWLKNNCPENHPLYEHLEWLRFHKVEIDHVMAVAGAQRVWDVILDRLSRQFPTRNYNRVLDVERDYTEPSFMREFDIEVMDKLTVATESVDEEMKQELEQVEGIRDIDELKVDMKSRRLKAYKQRKAYRQLRTKVESLTRWVEKQQWAKKSGGNRRA